MCVAIIMADPVVQDGSQREGEFIHQPYTLLPR